MRTVEVAIYQFNELSDKAKEAARQWWRDCENQDFETDFLYDDFVNMGRLLGVEINTRPVKLMGGGTRHDPCIYWMLHNQGAGACFEGSYRYAKGARAAIAKESGDSEKELMDIADRLQSIQRGYFYNLSAKIQHNSRSVHERSMSIEVYDYRTGNDAPTGAHLEVVECMVDFARWMHKRIEAEYDYRMSDEQVDESIRANEYEFTEAGKIAA